MSKPFMISTMICFSMTYLLQQNIHWYIYILTVYLYENVMLKNSCYLKLLMHEPQTTCTAMNSVCMEY